MRIFQELTKIDSGAVDTTAEGKTIQKVGATLSNLSFKFIDRQNKVLAQQVRLQIENEKSQINSFLGAEQKEFIRKLEKTNYTSNPMVAMVEYEKLFGAGGSLSKKIKELVHEQAFIEAEPFLQKSYLDGRTLVQNHIDKRIKYNGLQSYNVNKSTYIDNFSPTQNPELVKENWKYFKKTHLNDNVASYMNIEDYYKEIADMKDITETQYMISQITVLGTDGEYNYRAMIELVNNKAELIKNLDGELLDVTDEKRQSLNKILGDLAGKVATARKNADEQSILANLGNVIKLRKDIDNATSHKEKVFLEAKYNRFLDGLGPRAKEEILKIVNAKPVNPDPNVVTSLTLKAQYGIATFSEISEAFKAGLIDKTSYNTLINKNEQIIKDQKNINKDFLNNAVDYLLLKLGGDTFSKEDREEFKGVTKNYTGMYNFFISKNVKKNMSDKMIIGYGKLTEAIAYLQKNHGLTTKEITSNVTLLNKIIDDTLANNDEFQVESESITGFNSQSIDSSRIRGDESIEAHESRMVFKRIVANNPNLTLKRNKKTLKMIALSLGITEEAFNKMYTQSGSVSMEVGGN